MYKSTSLFSWQCVNGRYANTFADKIDTVQLTLAHFGGMRHTGCVVLACQKLEVHD